MPAYVSFFLGFLARSVEQENTLSAERTSSMKKEGQEWMRRRQMSELVLVGGS